MTPLGAPHRDAPVTALGQELGDRLFVLERAGEEHLLGDIDVSIVVLQSDRREELRVRRSKIEPPPMELAPTSDLSAPDLEHDDLHHAGITVQPKDILIHVAQPDDVLIGQGRLHGSYLVSIESGFLEGHLVSSGSHLVPERLEELVVPTVEEEHCVSNLLEVLGTIDIEDAGRGAPVHLIEEAGARSIAKR